MAELKLPRLLGAAKEFNISQDTLIEFLVSKGFSREELKPTGKLTEDMYRALQKEFLSTTNSDLKKTIKETADKWVDEVGKTFFGQTKASHQQNEILSLEVLIDPGTAPNEEVASILADLSFVFRQMGGSGIEFKLDHVSLKQNELA